MSRVLTDIVEPKALLISELKSLVGCPARMTIERILKLPGTIRSASATGLTFESFVTSTAPRVDHSVFLEIMAQDALIQCNTTIRHCPSQFVELAIPDQVQTVQRRRHPRVPVFYQAAITTVGVKSSVMSTEIRNISTGGCAATVPQPLSLGSTVTVNLQAAGMKPAEVVARVVRCTPMLTPMGRWEVGLAFPDIAPEQLDYLHLLVSQHASLQ